MFEDEIDNILYGTEQGSVDIRSQLDKMVCKFDEFIRYADGVEVPNEEADHENQDSKPLAKKSFILKTKCVDMLIELLMNEQIFKINNLVENVITMLVRITNSINVPVDAPKDQKPTK